MSTLPDAPMKAAVEEVIDLLGDEYDFERRDATTQEYVVNAEDVMMHIEALSSTFIRAVAGTENVDDYRGFLKATSDVQKGDRVAIGGEYHIVTSLDNWETHLEINLRESDVD